MVQSFQKYKQRLRDENFGSDVDPAVGTTASMNKCPKKPLLPAKSAKYAGKPTVVFDLDETLVYSRDGPLYARPGFQRLLAFTCLFFETVVWTAGTREYAEAVVATIDAQGAVQHSIYRHDKWYRDDGPKDLRMLGRDLDDVIMIENNPDSIRGNENNCVLVEDYEGPVEYDMTLYAVHELLKGLVEAKLPVPDYLCDSQHLKLAPAEESEPNWEVYHIDTNTVTQATWEWDFVPRLKWTVRTLAADMWVHDRAPQKKDQKEAQIEETARLDSNRQGHRSSKSKRRSMPRKSKSRRKRAVQNQAGYLPVSKAKESFLIAGLSIPFQATIKGALVWAHKVLASAYH